MKTKRRKILLLCLQVLLPVMPGLWTVLFRPETTALAPRVLVSWMLCINLLFILIYWRRLGWSRNERQDTALLLILFCFFPLLGHWLLDGMLDGSLWLQIGFYCMMQAGFYVAIVLAPDWVGKLQQRRYEKRVLSGREKFESRKEVMKARDREEREKSGDASESGENGR